MDESDYAFSDTLINASIKSQVESVKLISQRRAQFVKTAIKLFRHNGYHNTTIKQIAKAAGVSPGLIYQYVTDKEDILFLTLQYIVHAYKRVIPEAIGRVEDPLHKFMTAFEEYCRVLDSNRDASVLTYIETRTLSPERREALKQMELDVNGLMAQPLKESISAGLLKEINNIDLVVTSAAVIVHSWALKQWHLKDVTELEEFIKFHLELFLGSWLTEAGWRSYERYFQIQAKQKE